jgi:hypothetical protein
MPLAHAGAFPFVNNIPNIKSKNDEKGKTFNHHHYHLGSALSIGNYHRDHRDCDLLLQEYTEHVYPLLSRSRFHVPHFKRILSAHCAYCPAVLEAYANDQRSSKSQLLLDINNNHSHKKL